MESVVFLRWVYNTEEKERLYENTARKANAEKRNDERWKSITVLL
jgi:hypothetical protein